MQEQMHPEDGRAVQENSAGECSERRAWQAPAGKIVEVAKITRNGGSGSVDGGSCHS
jgi:hypothetical protein